MHSQSFIALEKEKKKKKTYILTPFEVLADTDLFKIDKKRGDGLMVIFVDQHIYI